MVPASFTFNVGYFEGQKHSKMWIVTEEDLTAMYEKYPSGEVLLWCDGNDEEIKERNPKRKRDEVQVSSRRQEREEEIDRLVKELKAKHGDKYEMNKLRLWGRMITSNLHDSTEEPPNVPMFGGASSYKKHRSSPLTEAAIAFANHLSGSKTSDSVDQQTPAPAIVSPGRAVDLRMKNLEQLRYLQQLHTDGILNESEYAEQKTTILNSLRKL